jgi:hypothetical protein
VQALDAYKISCVLDDMINKLEYLGTLKNNTGGEQAQMMSDDVTNVMKEQHSLEEEYGNLIRQRGELKGISNKPELNATKKKIKDVALKLKKSTKELCSKLQDTPDTEQNNDSIVEHKHNLLTRLKEVKEELHNLSFSSFKSRLEADIAAAGKYDEFIMLDRDLSK